MRWGSSLLDRTVLADRTVGYADTIVAFSVVNGFAFLVAFGEPDIRCSIVSVGVLVSLLAFFGIHAARFDARCIASLR